MTELKPCPFCGGKAELGTVINFRGTEYYVACSCCAINFASSREEAISKWNRRVYPPEVQQALERMEPRKPIFGIHKKIDLIGFFCPACEKKINKNNNLYFCKCGQALDWDE